MKIRIARNEDFFALCALELSAFTGDRLSPRSLKRLLHSRTAKVLIAEQDKSCLGYALVLFRKDSPAARLYSIAVDRKARGRGVGASLLSAAERHAHKHGCASMRLEVRADNGKARALYEKAGYRALVVIGDYYQDGMAAVRFEKRFGTRKAARRK